MQHTVQGAVCMQHAPARCSMQYRAHAAFGTHARLALCAGFSMRDQSVDPILISSGASMQCQFGVGVTCSTCPRLAPFTVQPMQTPAPTPCEALQHETKTHRQHGGPGDWDPWAESGLQAYSLTSLN